MADIDIDSDDGFDFRSVSGQSTSSASSLRSANKDYVSFVAELLQQSSAARQQQLQAIDFVQSCGAETQHVSKASLMTFMTEQNVYAQEELSGMRQKVFGDEDSADCSVAVAGIKAAEAALLVRQQSSFNEISSAATSKFDNFFAAFEVIDGGKKKCLTATEMQQGFEKVGASLSLQQLDVLCCSPIGKNKEFRYKELKSMVTASLASSVTNVQDAMALVLRVIKNKDMSTHTLFSMMDTSKKGKINRSEFIGGLTRFNIKLPADKESEMWQLVDANGDGDINYQEFKACFSSSANERVRLRQGQAAARAAEADRMKQAQAAANSLKRSGSDVSVTQIASAAGGGGGLEVDVDFEVEKKTQKLRRELQDVTRRFEREAAEYRLSHCQAIRKISEMSTQHAQEQQQHHQRVLELQDGLDKAQKLQEHFEKEARTLRLSMSETETNFGIELQAMRKAMADVQGTDYAMKCRALETKLQQMESTHKAEVLGLQEQLNKLLESANTQTRALPEVTEMTISELQRECGESRKEKQILLQRNFVLVAGNKKLQEQVKRAPKESHGDDHKRTEKTHSRSPTRHSSAAGGRSATPSRQDEAAVLFAAEREKTRHLEGRVQQLQLHVERLQEQLLTSQKLNDKNKKDCVEAETKYANMIMSQGQALKKRTQELEAQAAAACSERDVMKQQLEEVRAQAAASSSLHVSQLKAKSNDVQRMEEATEQLRATYVKRFKKLEDALQQSQDEVKKANKEKDRALMKMNVMMEGLAAHTSSNRKPQRPKSMHSARGKETDAGVGAENEFEEQCAAVEEQKSRGAPAAAARGGESPKGKRGGWLSQSVDLSNMSSILERLERVEQQQLRLSHDGVLQQGPPQAVAKNKAAEQPGEEKASASASATVAGAKTD